MRCWLRHIAEIEGAYARRFCETDASLNHLAFVLVDMPHYSRSQTGCLSWGLDFGNCLFVSRITKEMTKLINCVANHCVCGAVAGQKNNGTLPCR